METSSGPRQYLYAGTLVVVSAICCFPFSGFLGYQTVSLVLLLIVALLPLWFGVGPVLLAAGVSALVWNYFFIPPRFTFAIGHPQDILMFAAYFTVAAVTGTLTVRIRSREQLVRRREEYATALFTLTKRLTAAKTQDEVASVAVQTIASFFSAEVVLFLSQLDGDIFTAAHPSSTFLADEKEFGVAAWVYWNERKAGRFTDTLPASTATYYPVSGPRYPLGVIGVKRSSDDRISVEQESLLQNFIAQIASTLEREQLNELTRRTVVYAESEKLYRTLFNSISHELRTPISAIIGAAESLHHQNGSELTAEIQTAADRLNRLVENLLDMSRLESGRLAPKRDWCDMNDLFRAPLQRLKMELSAHDVRSFVPDAMPLVKLDFVLMEQVLTNLLYNAATYTPAGTIITLSCAVNGAECVIRVTDTGPGIPETSLGQLFQKFYRVPGSQPGGTGLGLSIVKGFIEAHRGTIAVRNAPGGGAEFTITIPTEMHDQHD